MNGLLPVDKPRGWTSHDVVHRVRRDLRVKKVGHTGTLDPLATGVLVLCLGRATRLSVFLTEHDKTYRTGIHLGVTTDTLDADGQVTGRSDRMPGGLEHIQEVVSGFLGAIEQVPPMYSARKIQGERLYALARSGREVERPPRPVHIHRLDVVSFHPPMLELLVHCSKGTYIRVLADDIGRRLGCGGHVAWLRRTAVGPIGLDCCVGVEDIRRLHGEDGLKSRIIDPNRALAHLGEVRLQARETRRFLNGNPVSGQAGAPAPSAGSPVRVVGPEGELLGIGRLQENTSTVQPIRVLQQVRNGSF